MDKKVLKERLEDLKKQIKLNSKDAHFADKLIDDLLSVKGQMGVTPVELDCGKKIDEFMGKTYRITLTDKGVLYHEFGGYSVFAKPNNTALYETLANIVKDKEENAELLGEDKERFDLAMSAIGYCLCVPKIAFADARLTFDVAQMVIKYIHEQYEALMNQELQEETVEKDEAFKNATLAVEELKEYSKE